MNELCTAIRSACCIYDELPDATASIMGGSGIRFFCAHGENIILISPRLLDRARAAYVAIEDICFTAISDSERTRRPVHAHPQMHLDSESGDINIAYTLDGPLPKEIRVRVHVCGVLLVDTRVAHKPFSGRTGGQLYVQHTLPRQDGYAAICPSGAHMAFSSYRNHCVNVFALPDFQFIGKLGKKGAGPIELNVPCGLCFTDAGTLLIADNGNDRVQHWALDGTWIASYPVNTSWCIAAYGDMIAVGCHGTGVHMLSLKSEAVTSKWLLGHVYAIVFVDANTLAIASTAIANTAIATINLFTLDGVLKVQLANNIISCGLAVCADGYLLASHYSQTRIRVFSLTGDELNTSPFAAYSFQRRPLSIALHTEHAYVYLEDVDSDDDYYDADYNELSRVCVFE